jgi:hypothetical protein
MVEDAFVAKMDQVSSPPRANSSCLRRQTLVRWGEVGQG